MDVYTTSFCLPHRASTRDLEDPASSFELPRDVAAAAAAQNNPGAHPITTHHTNGHRSNPSSARPASIPERVEEGDPEPPESSPSGSNGTVVPLSSGLTARRSTSSIASLGHSVTSASSAGGNTVDAASTAPSSAAASVTGAPIASSSGSGSTAGGKRGVDGADGTQRIVFETGEQLQRLCKEAMSNYQCMVTCSPLEAGKGYNFHLSGGYQQVMGARGYILRGSPFKQKAVVKVPRSEVLDAKENVKTEMRRKLDEIAALTKAHLAIVGQVSGTIGFGLETERNVEIVITGSYESVEQGRVRLLVLLDELVRASEHLTLYHLHRYLRSLSERSSFRRMRNRLQVTQHNFWPKTLRHSDHPGGDRYKCLLPYSLVRSHGRPRPHTSLQAESHLHNRGILRRSAGS